MKDFSGKGYRCLMDMLEDYQVSYKDYIKKSNRGYSMEEILRGIIRPKFGTDMQNICNDHLGKAYISKRDMCAAWDQPITRFEARIKRGWSLKKALETPKIEPRKSLDLNELYQGINGYDLVLAISAMNNLELPDVETLKELKQMRVEISLKEPSNMCKKPGTVPKPVKDHLNNWYISTEAMCNAWEISTKLYRTRVGKNGWPVKYALEKKKDNSGFCDHKGNIYSTIAVMCNSYGIPKLEFKERIDNGWSLEKALLTPVEMRAA